jgi:hypothetical protein
LWCRRSSWLSSFPNSRIATAVGFAGMQRVGHWMPTAAKKNLSCRRTQGVPVAQVPSASRVPRVCRLGKPGKFQRLGKSGSWLGRRRCGGGAEGGDGGGGWGGGGDGTSEVRAGSMVTTGPDKRWPSTEAN